MCQAAGVPTSTSKQKQMGRLLLQACMLYTNTGNSRGQGTGRHLLPERKPSSFCGRRRNFHLPWQEGRPRPDSE